MLIPATLKTEAVGFGLVFASLISSWIVGAVSGGFKFGCLARQIELVLPNANLPGFMERSHRRATELGFTPDEVSGEGNFLQGGTGAGFGVFTHARTLKRLQSRVDSGGAQAKVTLHLSYLDPIVADTGESAYRDAVLDYLSGRADTMRVVPNRSFGAINSLVGGIYAWLALKVLSLIRFEPLLTPLLMLTVANFGIGIVAIAAIRRKPGELTGQGLALAGIAANVSATVFAVFLALSKTS